MDVSRRAVLGAAGAGAAALSMSHLTPAVAGGPELAPAGPTGLTGDLVDSIGNVTVFDSATTAPGGTPWFLTKATARPCPGVGSGNEIFLLMTQILSGGDVYDSVYWTSSVDEGATWTTPALVPGFERADTGLGYDLAHIDATPVYHPPTGSIFIFAFTRGYRTVDGTVLPARFTSYAARDANGVWSTRQPLDYEDANVSDASPSSSSPIVMTDGRIMAPLSYRRLDAPAYRVSATALWDVNGTSLSLSAQSNDLALQVGQGMYEPNVGTTDLQTFYLALRADDNRGYGSRSTDGGLTWGPIQPWMWDDGTPLRIVRTQAKFLSHSDGLYLTFYYESGDNATAPRFRAPLYMARVDLQTMRLIRSTRQVLLPRFGDTSDPATAYFGGNYSTTPLGDRTSVAIDAVTASAYSVGNVSVGVVRWTCDNDLWVTAGGV